MSLNACGCSELLCICKVVGYNLNGVGTFALHHEYRDHACLKSKTHHDLACNLSREELIYYLEKVASNPEHWTKDIVNGIPESLRDKTPHNIRLDSLEPDDFVRITEEANILLNLNLRLHPLGLSA